MKFIYLHFILVFFLSCSSKQKINLNRPVETLPSWFKGDENFALRDDDGGYTIHPFFDSQHHLDEKNFGVNFILVTPENSEFRYFMDLVSGGLVVDQKYCEQKDVWNRTSGTLKLPPFNVGVIPRWLDVNGDPQEIIVFGRGLFYQNQTKKFESTYHAKIVGALNLQYCPLKLCRADDWVSNIIPVAIDPQDSKFSNVNSIEDLKREVSWKNVVLFLQNGKGRVLRAQKDLPSYRLLSEISAVSAIKFLKNKSYEFQYEKMNKMRDACHGLYSYIWETTKKLRMVEKKSDEEVIKEFTTKLFERNVYKDEKNIVEEDKLLENKTYQSFVNWFRDFYPQHGKDFKTCSKYTRMGNFSVDRDQFWFFVYFDLFFKMQDVGYVYSCDTLSWIKNFRNMKGEWSYSQDEFLKECTPASLDRGFESAANYMLELQRNDLEHFRFIAQDKSIGGSHQNIYNWVNFSGKKFRCIDKDENRENEEMISRKIFEEMTPWKAFSKENSQSYDLTF